MKRYSLTQFLAFSISIFLGNFTYAALIDSNDIEKQIYHRKFTNYIYNGEVFETQNFFNRSHNSINEDLLRIIKPKIHYSMTTNQLPNLAQCFITFHYEVSGQSKVINFSPMELFLDGEKYFYKEDMEFKKSNNLISSYQDIITNNERTNLSKIQDGKKNNISFGILMEEKLRSFIAGGAWRDNCFHSEASLLLRLRNNLQKLLNVISQKHQDDTITIKACVIGISSYRYCCHKCRFLIQGFQWNLKNFMEKLAAPNIQVDDEFGSLAITYGQIKPNSYDDKLPKLREELIELKTNEHKLTCSIPL